MELKAKKLREYDFQWKPENLEIAGFSSIFAFIFDFYDFLAF